MTLGRCEAPSRLPSRHDPLITRAYGSLFRTETSGENRQIGRLGAMLRLSLAADQRHRPRKAGIVTPWRNWRKKREGHRVLSAAFSVNHGVGRVCNQPSNSVVHTPFGHAEPKNMTHHR